MQERSVVIITNEAGQEIELPAFTCVHCQRVVVKNPERKRDRNICLKCNALTCDSVGCTYECNEIMKDAEKAHRDIMNQPWLMRDPEGYPVYRLNEGGVTYEARRIDCGYTDRQLGEMSKRAAELTVQRTNDLA
jgi:hypothetical protein